MPERIIRLDRVGRCVGCDMPKSKTLLDVDHYLPQCLYKQPDTIDPSQNPFKGVVTNWRNKFVLCRKKCHEVADAEKMASFRGASGNRIDPVGLIYALWDSYPLTQNPRFRTSHLTCMIDTETGFIAAVGRLNGGFPAELVRRYEKAAEVALQHVIVLRAMRTDFRRTGFID